jgi:hypothetical protein
VVHANEFIVAGVRGRPHPPADDERARVTVTIGGERAWD